jgi:hypoxanthine phosphoribosyltransferase
MTQARPVCFFISPINKKGSKERKHADRVTEFILKKATKGLFTVVRADKMARPGIISLEIIKNVKSAPMVAADLTFSNPNVFYELALRHQTGFPYVQMASTGTTLPFDVAPINTVFFDLDDVDSIKQAIKELRAQIKAGAESGFVDSPATLVPDAPVLGRGDGPHGWTSVQQLLMKVTRQIRRNFKPDVVITMSGPGSIPAFLQLASDDKDIPVVAATTFPTSRLSNSIKKAAREGGYFHVKSSKWDVLIPPLVEHLPKGTKILLFDDRIRSGETHQLVRAQLERKGFEVRSAALIVSKEGKNTASWYAEESDTFSFPWGDQDGRR